MAGDKEEWIIVPDGLFFFFLLNLYLQIGMEPWFLNTMLQLRILGEIYYRE